jgi:hypothetical protein
VVPLVGIGWEAQSGRGLFVVLREYGNYGADFFRARALRIAAKRLS